MATVCTCVLCSSTDIQPSILALINELILDIRMCIHVIEYAYRSLGNIQK